MTYLSACTAGEARHHYINRIPEGYASEGLLAADISKSDITTLKILQSSTEHQAWLRENAKLQDC